MKALRKQIDKIKPHFEKGGKLEKLHSLFDAIEVLIFVPDRVTTRGSHIRDGIDMKRVMITVFIALIPAVLFGIYNIGFQYYQSINVEAGFWEMIWFGFLKFLPLLLVSYIVGLGIEIIFAQIRGHEVNEGYFVTGLLIPLIVPVDVPLWQLALAVVFAVIIGKEVFGGTGMNILNPALTIRAFLFFAYPTWMSGDKVWVTGAVERAQEISNGANLDAISGETILGALAQGNDYVYSTMDMFYGFIPGSVGETSTLLILLGAVYLLYTKVASWRIMLSAAIGAIVMGLIFNQIVDLGWVGESSKFYGLMSTPFWQHLIIGGFAFGVVFMATDPVTGSQTNKGKWIYGFLIGFISILIRVFNPAYPEGVMLAILLMNVFAPTIDHYVVQGNVKKRMKRAKLKTA